MFLAARLAVFKVAQIQYFGSLVQKQAKDTKRERERERKTERVSSPVVSKVSTVQRESSQPLKNPVPKQSYTDKQELQMSKEAL